MLRFLFLCVCANRLQCQVHRPARHEGSALCDVRGCGELIESNGPGREPFPACGRHGDVDWRVPSQIIDLVEFWISLDVHFQEHTAPFPSYQDMTR